MSAEKVARSSILYLVGDISGILVGIPALAYFARTLTVAELGIVVAFTIVLGFLPLLSDPGFSNALITYSSEALGRRQNAAPLVRNLTLIGFGLGVALGVAFLLLGRTAASYFLGIQLPPDMQSALSIDIVLTSVAPYLDSGLKGFGDFRALMITKTVRSVTRQLSGVLFLSIGLGVSGIVFGWILGDFVNILLSLSFFRLDIRPYSSSPTLKVKTNEVVQFSFPLFCSNLIGYFAQYFDQIVLLLVLSIENLAQYGVAFVIFSYALRLPESASIALLPHYARRKEAGIAVLEREVRAASRYLSLLFTPLFMGIASVSLPLIMLLAGPQYSEAAGALSILCGIYALTMSSIGFNQVLYAVKATAKVAILEIVEIIVGISTAILLANHLGIYGIAFARGVAEIAIYVLEVRILSKLIHLSLDRSALVKISACGLFMALITYFIQQLYFAVQLLPIYVLIASLSYVLLLRKLRVIRIEDIDVARKLLRGRFHSLADLAEGLFGLR